MSGGSWRISLQTELQSAQSATAVNPLRARHEREDGDSERWWYKRDQADSVSKCHCRVLRREQYITSVGGNPIMKLH